MPQLTFPEFKEHKAEMESNLVFEVSMQVGSGKTTQICAKSFDLANKYARNRASDDLANGIFGRAYIVKPIPYLRG